MDCYTEKYIDRAVQYNSTGPGKIMKTGLETSVHKLNIRD